MKTISLTQNKVAIVDDEDYERLNQWKWYCNRHYAVRQSKKIGGKQTTIFMHKEIVVCRDPYLEVDHINGNKLDNRKANLRLCTPSQNIANTPVRKDNETGYKGVSHEKRWGGNTWRARIQINGQREVLGYFASPEDAARAYDRAAKEIFGEFAHLNFLESTEQ